MNKQAATSECTLRLHGLRAVDTAVVEIFLKLAQQQTRCRWILSNQKDVDLLLVAPQHLDPRELLDWQGEVVWVTPKSISVAHDGRMHLTQPLQLESFIEVLHHAEQRMARSAHAAAPASAPTCGTAVGARPPVQASGAAPAAVPAAPHGSAADPVPAFDAASACRLLRWPQASSLSAHRYYPRLASFLANRHLTLSQLVTLSNVSWPVCVEFMNQMHRQGLLDVRAPVTAPTAQAPRSAGVRPAAAGTPATTPQPQATTGLIGRLRERLGLSRSDHAGGSLMGLAR